MSGADKTPTVQPLFGLIMPWTMRLQTSEAGQGRGIDWTEYGAEAGRLVPSASTTLALESIGESDDATLTACTVKVSSPGTPGLGGAGVLYRKEVSGTAESLWYGADGAHVFTGFQRISQNHILNPCLISLGDGTALAIYSRSTTSTNANLRAADGTWGSDVVIDTTSSGISCGCLGFDGAVLAFSVDTYPGGGTANTMRVYRSTDSGATWTLQTYDCGITAANLHRIRASRFGNTGQIAMFATYLSGGVYTVQQWVSVNGGVTFDWVATSPNGWKAWDVREGGGFLHFIYGVQESTYCDFCYIKVGDAAGSVADLTAVQIKRVTGANVNFGAFLCHHPTGRIYVGIDDNATLGLIGFYSDDGGTTWVQRGPAYKLNASTTVQGGMPSGEWMRGTLVCIMNNEGHNGGSIPFSLFEYRFGGHSRATASREIYQSLDNVFIPLDTLANAGWSTSDTGVPTRTLSTSTGQRIQTGVGVTARNLFTYADSSPNDSSIVIRVVSGTATLSFVTNGASVTVVVTSTTLNIYDSGGAAGTPFSHGVSSGDYIEIRAVVRPATSKAAITYRAYSASPERAFNSATILSSLSATGTQIEHNIVVAASSDVYVKTACVSWPTDTALQTGWDNGHNLDPVPLSYAYVPLTSGWSIRATQGLAVKDDTTWDMRPVSVYRAENMLPSVNPSPSVMWKAADLTSDALFSLSIYEGDTNVITSQEAYAVYLDGLVGVSSLDITDALATSTVTLGASFKYTALSGGKTIIPATSGARNTGAWVRADELVGWYFKDSAGTVSRVIGNTEGSLTWGTVSERRAVLYLATAVTGTAQTGTLYPARVLLVRYGAAGSSTIDVSITAASQYDPTDATRAIGVLAAGRVTFLPPPALNDTRIIPDESRILNSPDGSRLDAQRFRPRTRSEWAWMESIHDERQVRGNATSPDYVIAYTGGSPAGDAEGIGTGLIMEGFLQRLYNAGKPPVIVAPAISVGSGAGWVVQRTGEFLYGRLTGDVRIERVPGVGVRGTSQVARLSQIAIEEER